MKTFKILLLAFFTGLMISCQTKIPYLPVQQKAIQRIEQMPNHPRPYHMIDWQQRARVFDSLVYDFNQTGDYWPLIWLDDSRRNFDQTTYGIYTAMGDVRMGPDHNGGKYHESLASMAAVFGATLVGIDKSDQHGYNFVKMEKNYFNTENGWNIIMDITSPELSHLGGAPGRSFWYDLFPNMLFYAIADHYPETEGFEEIQRTVADQHYKAAEILGDNYHYTSFHFGKMEPLDNGKWKEQDAAAGFSWLLYMAFKKFNDPKYLEASKKALEALLNLDENYFFEIIMPFGAYIAARMNAEQGTDFDFKKVLDWTFDGTAVVRKGWGVVVDRWGDYDVSGLQGSTIHNGGYVFFMNTCDMAWALVPMVRYDQSYARAIGKWMLNAANASRLFYPDIAPDEHQTLPEMKDLARGVIAYEGIVKKSTYQKYDYIQPPVVQGDGPNWHPDMPEISQYSVYGSSHVGIFGGIINTTNVDEILQLDVLAADLYSDNAYPTFLYYNPWDETKEVDISVGDAQVDLLDIVNREFVSRNVTGTATFSITGDAARVIVIVPAKGKVTYENNKMLINGVVVDYSIL